MCIIIFMHVIIQCLVFIICVYLVLVYNSQSGCRRSDRQSVFCSETPTDAQRWFHGEMSCCLLHTHNTILMKTAHRVIFISSFCRLRVIIKMIPWGLTRQCFVCSSTPAPCVETDFPCIKKTLIMQTKVHKGFFGQIFALKVSRKIRI